MKKLVLLLFLINLGFFSYSQNIEFNKLPEDYQLFPRDDSNKASVVFSGTYNGGLEIAQLKLKVFKNGVLYDQKKSKIQNKTFTISSLIKAGLYNYKFELYIENKNKEELVISVDNITCGDAYLITGQSNSHASSKKSIYSNSFIRSFGVKTGYEKYSEEDKKIRWGLGTGNCENCEGESWDKGYGGGWFVKNSHGIGVWGMELAKLLVEKYKIPVCIINGGSGSSTIEQNMLYPEKISLETSFGRLAYRVDQAGLKNHIKAIFYHQGESDANKIRSSSYADNFDTLNKDWLRVYKGIKKIYIFQIHPGCGNDFQSEIRETQYQISKKYNHVDIMSTLGVVGHDGCHFSYKGYKEFASRILPLVSRDFFDNIQTSVITPPQLLNVYYSGKKEITMDFDQSIVFEKFLKVKGVNRQMKNQFYFIEENNDHILNGIVKGLVSKNKSIIIKLNSEKKYSRVIWPPNKEYLDSKDVYNGPWIRGSINNIGALSFNRQILKNN